MNRKVYGNISLMVLLVLVGILPVQDLSQPNYTAVAEAYRLFDAVGGQVWPGWSAAPFSLLLASGEYEFLITTADSAGDFHPTGFDSLLQRRVFRRPRQFSPDLLATFPVFSAEPCIVVGAPEATGKNPTAWVLTVLHEHFHQLQMSRPGYFAAVAALDLSGDDQSGMWMLDYPFPYDDPQVQQRFGEFSVALGAVLDSIDYAGFAPALRRFKAAWADLREALSPRDYRYFQFQMWQEGVARYVEWMCAKVAAQSGYRASAPFAALPGAGAFAREDSTYRARLFSELKNPALEENRRVSFYAAGAGVALLLDAVSPRWKTVYLERPFLPEAYFQP